MPERENPFEKHINEIDFKNPLKNDPLGIGKIKNPENRAEFLETPEERLEYIAGSTARKVLLGVTMSFSTIVSKEENIQNLIYLAGKTQDPSFSTPKARKIRELLLDRNFLSDFYDQHDIDKDFMDFQMITYSSKKRSYGTQSPDRTGFGMVIDHSKKASDIEMDQRIPRPIIRTPESEQVRSFYSEGGVPDLTGLAFLYRYCQNLRPLYLNSLSMGKPDFSDEHSPNSKPQPGNVMSPLLDGMQQMHLYYAGLSYEGTLLAIHLYEEIIDEYIEKHHK